MWCVSVQVEGRQKLLEAKEKEEDEDKKAKINEDAPGNYQVCFLVRNHDLACQFWSWWCTYQCTAVL